VAQAKRLFFLVPDAREISAGQISVKGWSKGVKICKTFALVLTGYGHAVDAE
jgi:hypothetical protein